MAYTATDVKNLRERTGAGMMDCKKALDETSGDMEAAVDLLRAKGLAAVAKKSSRTAAEGLVGVAVSGTKGVAVEVNSETDFVAKNEQFQDFVRSTTEVALGAAGDDVDALLAAAFPGGGTVADKLTNNVATIGENQKVRRIKTVSVASGVVVPYMHNAAAPMLGKIGVLSRLNPKPVPTCSYRWASRSRCTSPLLSRWRCRPTISIPKCSNANARSLSRKRPRKPPRPARKSRQTSCQAR
jgi:elongation factor Ts